MRFASVLVLDNKRHGQIRSIEIQHGNGGVLALNIPQVATINHLGNLRSGIPSKLVRELFGLLLPCRKIDIGRSLRLLLNML